MKKYVMFIGWIANISLIGVLMFGVLLSTPDRASAAPTQHHLASACTPTHPQIPPPPQRPSWSATTWHFGWFATCEEATWQFYVGVTALGVDVQLRCGGSTQSITIYLYDANNNPVNSMALPCNAKSSEQFYTQGLKSGTKYRVNYDQSITNVAASYVVYTWPASHPAPPPSSTSVCPQGAAGPSGEACIPMSNCPSGYGYVNGNKVGICLTPSTNPTSSSPPTSQAAYDACVAGYFQENGSNDGPAASMLCSSNPPGYQFYRECRVGGGTAAICGSGSYTLYTENNFNSGGSPAHSGSFDAEYVKAITITGTIQCDHAGTVTIDLFSGQNSPQFHASASASCDQTSRSWSFPSTTLPDGTKTVEVLMDWNGNYPGSGGPLTLSGSYTVTGTV